MQHYRPIGMQECEDQAYARRFSISRGIAGQQNMKLLQVISGQVNAVVFIYE